MSLANPQHLGHPNFDLHLASSQNASALSRLMTETFVAAYGHVVSAEQLQRHIERSYSAKLIAKRINAGKIEVWTLRAAADFSKDAGYLQLGLRASPPELLQTRTAVPLQRDANAPQKMPLPALEVQRCYLRPEFIGSGAGALLIRHAQRRATELGAQMVHLSVYQQAPRAVRFYEKHGFAAAGAVQFYIDDVAFDDWLMVWMNPDLAGSGSRA